MVCQGPPNAGMGGMCTAAPAGQERLESDQRLVGLLGAEVGETEAFEKPLGRNRG